MRFKNELIGVLTVFSHKADSFDQEDLNLLETIADQIADGLETSRLRKKLRKVRFYKNVSVWRESCMIQ